MKKVSFYTSRIIWRIGCNKQFIGILSVQITCLCMLSVHVSYKTIYFVVMNINQILYSWLAFIWCMRCIDHHIVEVDSESCCSKMRNSEGKINGWDISVSFGPVGIRRWNRICMWYSVYCTHANITIKYIHEVRAVGCYYIKHCCTFLYAGIMYICTACPKNN